MQAYDKTTYVMTVTDQIRCKRARAMVAEELEQHIADQEEEYLLLGLDKAEAEAEAVRQMGDPVTVGNDLDRIHRPRLDLKLLFMTMLLILAGLIVQYIQAEGGEAEWFIRQLLYTEIGIAAMAAVYFVDYTIIGKYPLQLWGGWTVFLVLGIVFRIFPETNGQFRIYPLLFLMIPVYVGFVYRFRGSSYWGLLMCGGAAALNLLICCMIPSRTAMTEQFLIYAAILTWAVHKGWFSVPKGKAYLTIYIPIAAVLSFVTVNTAWQASKGGYAFARLDAALHPEKYAGDLGYIGLQIRKILEETQILGKGSVEVFQNFISNNPAMAMGEISSDMMFTYILGNYGLLAGMLLLVLLAGLIVRIFTSAFQQKNQLGGMLAFGCAGLFLTQTVFYILYNLGYTFFSPMYLPFFSRAGSGIITTCMLMGLVLSVYRNTNLVKEKAVKILPRYRIRIEKII